jgi:hypothetical protein
MRDVEGVVLLNEVYANLKSFLLFEYSISDIKLDRQRSRYNKKAARGHSDQKTLRLIV